MKTNTFIPADVIDEAVAWRRDLHRHPELAYQERRTARFVAQQLSRFGLNVYCGHGGTGVVGTLSRGTGRRAIGIRADMDALPIQEQSGVTHASCTPGTMHACGHDGHVAMALAAARMCAAMPDLDGTLHFIFQPAEENEGGARRMIEDGLFRQFPCDEIYALHNWPALPLGTYSARPGCVMAALGAFEVEVQGSGCHGAMPHQGSDVLLAAGHIVTALQGIVSRNMDPLQSGVISVTQIHGGSTWNVLPDSCLLRGTTRHLEDEVGKLIAARMAEVANGIAAASGCKAAVRHETRIPVTVNHPLVTKHVHGVLAAMTGLLQAVDAPPSMGSEDFAFMLQAVPGCYLWLGSAQEGHTAPLHSPNYDFNDNLVDSGVRYWCEIARVRLSSMS